jgi:hypothetical protein
MEEQLELFQGVSHFGKWTQKYGVLRENVLTICNFKGGEAELRVHLHVAEIREQESNSPAFQIHTGTTDLHLRAPSLAAKSKWINNLCAN